MDTATQVSVSRPDLLPAAPGSWAEVPTLTLDQPGNLNAVTTAMSERPFGLIGQVEADDAVRAVVRTEPGTQLYSPDELWRRRARWL